jgi:diadenosine tetraphosphate (Ap4A) HIT family hydrolase
VPEPCHTCELNAAVETLPPRERLYLDDHWRVAHGWSSLPGWLVVASRRHVLALDELGHDEVARLGPLLRAASLALRGAVGCEKTYVMLFAEHPRYPHLHVHVVPRMAWFGEDDVAWRTFRFLSAPEEEHVPVDERERLAGAIGDAIRRELEPA